MRLSTQEMDHTPPNRPAYDLPHRVPESRFLLMYGRHSIIPHRMHLRQNDRRVAVQSILRKSQTIMQHLNKCEAADALSQPQEKGDILPNLNNAIKYVLDAYQPGWDRLLSNKECFDIELLSEEQFWEKLYDLLWRCVINAELKQGMWIRFTTHQRLTANPACNAANIDKARDSLSPGKHPCSFFVVAPRG